MHARAATAAAAAAGDGQGPDGGEDQGSQPESADDGVARQAHGTALVGDGGVAAEARAAATAVRTPHTSSGGAAAASSEAGPDHVKNGPVPAASISRQPGLAVPPDYGSTGRHPQPAPLLGESSSPVVRGMGIGGAPAPSLGRPGDPAWWQGSSFGEPSASLNAFSLDGDTAADAAAFPIMHHFPSADGQASASNSSTDLNVEESERDFGRLRSLSNNSDGNTGEGQRKRGQPKSTSNVFASLPPSVMGFGQNQQQGATRLHRSSTSGFGTPLARPPPQISRVQSMGNPISHAALYDSDDDDDSDEEELPVPLHLMRNVSGFDMRSNRLDIKCTSLTSGSEANFFRLMSAASKGDASALLRTLEHMTVKEASQLNPTKDSPTYGLNPLHVANSTEVIGTLISFGVPVDIQGLNGQTPLHTHTHHNRLRVIRYLIERGAQVDAKTAFDGSTPLQWAVAANNRRVVEMLVKANASVTYQNFSGNTVLHMVSSVQVARFLVEHGARTDIVNNQGRIPLEEAAARAGDEAQLDVALYLLDLSRRLYVQREGGTGHTPTEADEAGFEELDHYRSSEHPSPTAQEKMRRAVAKHALHTRAQQQWQLLKRVFITGEKVDRTAIPGTPRRLSSRASLMRSASGLSAAGQSSSQEFFSTFFEVMVKERPALALKLLDKQKTFLYWENDARIYSYNTTLLGSIPHSSYAVKQMVFHDQYELISHPVVQYALNLRWILFTREIIWFEFLVHFLFLALILFTTLDTHRHINLSCLSPFSGIWVDPSVSNFNSLAMLLANLVLLVINLRYIRIQVLQARLAGLMAGSKLSFKKVLHSRLRNEPYYLVPHVLILVSQILRCLPDPATPTNGIKTADVLVALVSPQLFYRALSFGEGFQSIGVPLSTIRSMIADNVIYFLLVFVLVTGFSHSMHLLYRDDPESEQYGTLAMSWTTLFFFTFNLDVDSINSEQHLLRKWAAFFIVGVYMFIVSLVTFQLICAVMTNKYEEVNANAKAQYLMQKARLILFYEQYETAQNWFFFGDIEKIAEAGGEYLPPGDTRHFVKELVDQTVLIEVPQTYLDECVRFRNAMNSRFHFMRTFLFRRWMHLRGSNSFVFPKWPSVRLNASIISTSSRPRSLSADVALDMEPDISPITSEEKPLGGGANLGPAATESTPLFKRAARALQEKTEYVLLGQFTAIRKVPEEPQGDQRKFTIGSVRGPPSPKLTRISSLAGPAMMLNARSVSGMGFSPAGPTREQSTNGGQNGSSSRQCSQCSQVLQLLQSMQATQQQLAQELAELRGARLAGSPQAPT